MTEEQRRVRDDSDGLLGALDDLKRLERTKRKASYSTPEFHDLAAAVEDQAKYVFRVAHEEDVDGDRAQRSERSINEVRPSEEAGAVGERRDR